MATETIDSNALPYEFDVTTPPGDTYERRWKLQYDLDDGTGPQNLSLSGATLTLKVAKGTDTTALVSRTLTPTGAAAGEFTMNITAAESAAYDGTYQSKVVVVFPVGHTVFPNGATKTVLLGTHEYHSKMA